jgi:multiple sugar transport system ATP-binding protein
MNRGVLQQVDTPLNIYRHPQTLFVATFIGSPPMNIVECRADQGVLSSMTGTFKYRLPDHGRDAVVNVPSAYFGIRSEDVSIVANDEPDADMQGEVQLREPLGDETIYLINVGGQRLTVKAEPKLVLQPGEKVALKINPNRIHLFDSQSVQSLLHKEVHHV